ncbi:hypothetical protein E2C01_028386 [Portunus trituberculatus]|uniref:Uncharacterized protein n=1 Tax=Portunus trituberculatus TaxID=210409 RepID=A0A5B7ENX4_PORTR|nr:hypothetical protein [Portunus trituberculatus]
MSFRFSSTCFSTCWFGGKLVSGGSGGSCVLLPSTSSTISLSTSSTCLHFSLLFFQVETPGDGCYDFLWRRWRERALLSSTSTSTFFISPDSSSTFFTAEVVEEEAEEVDDKDDFPSISVFFEVSQAGTDFVSTSVFCCSLFVWAGFPPLPPPFPPSRFASTLSTFLPPSIGTFGIGSIISESSLAAILPFPIAAGFSISICGWISGSVDGRMAFSSFAAPRL